MQAELINTIRIKKPHFTIKYKFILNPVHYIHPSRKLHFNRKTRICIKCALTQRTTPSNAFKIINERYWQIPFISRTSLYRQVSVLWQDNAFHGGFKLPGILEVFAKSHYLTYSLRNQQFLYRYFCITGLVSA